jgi:transglutaminase-like putative cysteine protease
VTPVRVDRISLSLTYAIAGLGIGASLLHLSALCTLLLVVFVAGGIWGDLRGRPLLTSWTLTSLVVMGFLAALALPSANGPIGRVLAATIVLLGGKLMAPKAARDHFQVMLLSLLLLVGSAILTADISFALLFMLYLILCTVELVWIPFGTALRGRTVSRGFVRRVLLVGAGLVVGSVPLVLLFFVGLPRATAPLWRAAPSVAGQVSGFSDHVSLGDIGRIAESNAVAFRVEFPEHAGSLRSVPYWRGLVFEASDGVTWQERPHAQDEPYSVPVTASGSGETVVQLVYLEPNGERALFGLDRIGLVDGDQVGSAGVRDGAAYATRPITQRIRYTVLSDPAPFAPTALDPGSRAADLAVPAGLPPAVADTAAEVVGGEIDLYQKAQLLLQHFQTGGYTYSLSPPGGSGHPLDVFLTTKIGYCEHFASAMALMLRSVGVPARMVVGYLGGDYNPNGDYYLVRQRSAHAWVEAYIGGGWLRLDPTPVDQGPGSATAQGRVGSATLLIDALRHKWDTMVLGYDLRKQAGLFRSLSGSLGSALHWRPGAVDIAVVAVLAAALGVAGALLRRSGPTDPVIALYARLHRRLRRRGLIREPAEGPRDFALRASTELPGSADTIAQVTDGYVRLRYGGRRMPQDEVKRLREALRRV